MNRFFRWLNVQAYKHNGTLHRQWSPAYLAEETEDYWALCSKSSLVTESDGRRWMTNEHAVFLLFKKRWLNVIAMKKANGYCYYVNIASPTINDQGLLRYIDYDLDLKLFPDETIKALDEQEFEHHASLYNYSPELKRAIKKSFKEVREMMEKGTFPFVDSEADRIYKRFIDQTGPFVESFQPKTK